MADLTRAAFKDAAGSFASFGVQDVQSFDYADADNMITSKVYHGVSIIAGVTEANKSVVGRIQSWQPDSYTREGVHLYELANTSWGRPVEYIPGKATGFTIAITRAEVWFSEIERAVFNDQSITLYDDLIDQNKPFTVREFWIRDGADQAYNIWTYRGCWFQNKNTDAITADGDGITRITATLAYVSKTHTGAGA